MNHYSFCTNCGKHHESNRKKITCSCGYELLQLDELEYLFELSKVHYGHRKLFRIVE